MSSTYTRSDTFSRTHAHYLASKVAADLYQMQRFYGKPLSSEIDDYIEELTTLLAGGYLGEVKYGFRRDGLWILCLHYTVTATGLDLDDRSGRVSPGINISGASWYSYLSKSDAWATLSEAAQQQIEASIPVRRSPAPEPGTAAGNWVEDKTYSSNGTALARRTFRPL